MTAFLMEGIFGTGERLRCLFDKLLPVTIREAITEAYNHKTDWTCDLLHIDIYEAFQILSSGCTFEVSWV